MIAKVLSVVGSAAQKLSSKDSQPVRVKVKRNCGSFEANLGIPEKKKIHVTAGYMKIVERYAPFWPLEGCDLEGSGLLCIVARQAKFAGEKRKFRARLILSDGTEEDVEVRFK